MSTNKGRNANAGNASRTQGKKPVVQPIQSSNARRYKALGSTKFARFYQYIF